MQRMKIVRQLALNNIVRADLLQTDIALYLLLALSRSFLSDTSCALLSHTHLLFTIAPRHYENALCMVNLTRRALRMDHGTGRHALEIS